MSRKQNQVKNINFFREKYPKVLKKLAKDFDQQVAQGATEWKYRRAVKILHDAMWLIECEETNNPEQPYCIYYHESGNVFGWNSFKDETTFIDACKKFLHSTWGIQSA